MISVAEFKALLTHLEPEEIVEEYILADGAMHVSAANILKIKTALAKKYRIEIEDLDIWIVGSAKLGFSITEKYIRATGAKLPRYRSFSSSSDVDVAVVCPKVFERIWLELSSHAHYSARTMPWDSESLGDYLVHGWLRLDKAPKGARLPLCDDWFDCFRALSADSTMGRRKYSGGLYYSREFLLQYQCRSVTECKQVEVKI